MGCLKVDIELVKRLEVSVECGNNLSFVVSIVRKKIQNLAKIILGCINDIFVSARVSHDPLSVDVSSACGGMTLDIGLVCMTNLNTQCYLKVLDGYLLTFDGCYLKVSKG